MVRVNLTFDFLTSRSVRAEVLSRTIISIDFNADSSSRFPFRARRNRQTRLNAHIPTLAVIQLGVGNNFRTVFYRNFILFIMRMRIRLNPFNRIFDRTRFMSTVERAYQGPGSNQIIQESQF